MTSVAYIANEFPSPLEPYVMDEINALRSNGVRVICCTGKRSGSSLTTERELAFREETLQIHPMGTRDVLKAATRLAVHRGQAAGLLRDLLRDAPQARMLSHRFGHTLMGAALAASLEGTGVEHIHAHHGYFASWIALVAAELLGIGFSFTLHGSDLLLGRGGLLDAKLARCRFCVTVSDFNRDYILSRYPQLAPSKIVVNRLGVDPVISVREMPTQRFSQPFSILSVGRLHAVKNHKFLVEACARLRDEGVEFVCWIAGDGPERPALEFQIHRLDLQKYVLLLGMVPREELGRFYRGADAFVLTSLSEGIPVALMEAMAHECVVLAPEITGIPELVEQGQTGFLYKPGSMRGLVEALRFVFERRDSLENLRLAAAGKVADEFDRRKNLQRFVDLFLARIRHWEEAHAHSLLQQIQLPV